jgi:hypothetical protein
MMTEGNRDERGRVLARAHGAFNIVSGLWPLVSVRSFEAVFGPKTERWLQYTVAGLLVGIGWSQVRAGAAAQWQAARRIGMATAATLLAIDLVYVPRGRIPKTYLLDAVMEAAWLVAWTRMPRSCDGDMDGNPYTAGVKSEKDYYEQARRLGCSREYAERVLTQVGTDDDLTDPTDVVRLAYVQLVADLRRNPQ